jgi:hypothetical protein
VRGLGLPAELTVAPLLKAAGVDPAALMRALTAADRKAVTAAVALKYTVSVDTRLLVEPKTGAIVSLDRIDQVLNATPDLSRLVTVLAAPAYARDAAVQAVRTGMKRLPAGPTPAMRLEYGQTPASVADFAAYAQDKRDQAKLVEYWIPGVVSLLGVAALISFIVLTARRRVGGDLRT